MRNLTPAELRRIELLTKNSVDFTLIEPTRTGLIKSIMDATGIVRTYLKEKKLHDYDMQKQGPNSKVQIPALFIKQNDLSPSIASLYRPITKKGDPRIWFKGLGNYVCANDIICIFTFDRKLIVLNITKIDIEYLIKNRIANPFQNLVKEIRQSSNKIANELLLLLKRITANGLIPALLNADTAVGRTLEYLLGININSSKKPDYKGIELKSFRDKKSNRKNLFAQVPDWSLSKFKSSAEILNNFGYTRGTDFKLYCTVSTRVRNSQGLRLKMDGKMNRLLENSEIIDIGDFITWNLETLHERFLEKHNETFWIAADSFMIDGKEYFQYKEVEHTKKPIVSQFDILLEQGIITLDHLIKRNVDGKIVEKGPLFKIRPNSINMLFPPSNTYSLI